MHADAGDAQIFAARHIAIEASRVGDGDAEFVLLQPGDDIRTGLRLHVGIHPKRNLARSFSVLRPGNRGALGFGFALQVEHQRYPPASARSISVGGLADTREHNAGGRTFIDVNDALEFAAADHVKAGAHPSK